MRTTLQLDEELIRAAKKAAAETGRTLTAVIEDALRQALAKPIQPAGVQRFKLPTLNLGETMPGVDLNDSAALLELMEEDVGSI